MNKISIIIPILNETDGIENLLNHLIENSTSTNISEIIVVDGGSTDGSQDIVSAFFKSKPDVLEKNKFLLIETSKGRAKQMNTGAEMARGNVLYFLHADSFPPKNFDSYILEDIEKGNLAGCFKMKFDSSHWWLQLAGWLTSFSWRACRGGDQSQFILKSLFNDMGKFDERFTVYEDNDLINKLYAKKQFVVIQQWLTTSARRYNKAGVWKLQYHFWAIYVKKWFGASADDLYVYYKKYIE